MATRSASAVAVIDVEGVDVTTPRLGAGDAGVADMKRAGVAVTQESYPMNRREQLLKSIDKISLVTRHGKNDSAVVGYTGDVLIAAGAKQAGTKKRVQVLQDHLQSIAIYGGDPIGAEYIVSAAGTLCLRKGLCVRLADCDGLLATLASMCAGAGIPVQIVGLYRGEKDQPHVLMAFEDDDGEWKYADPTLGLQPGTRKKAAGFTDIGPCKEEFWSDPLSHMKGPEIVVVGVGSAQDGIAEAWRRADGAWWQKNEAGWWRRATGAGNAAWKWAGDDLADLSPLRAAGAGSVTSWAPTTIDKVVAGKRYFFSALIAGTGHLNDPLQTDWQIEDSEPGGVQEGYARAYRFRGIAKTTAPHDGDSVEYLAVFEEVVGDQAVVLGQPPATGAVQPTTPGTPSATPAANPPTVVLPPPLDPGDQESGVGLGAVLAVAAVGAVATGLAWGWWKHHRMHVQPTRRRAAA